MVEGLKRLSDLGRAEVGARPLVLIGHSMGSLMAQHYMQRWGGELDGVVLSGSSGRPFTDLDQAIAALERVSQADQPSELLAQMFAAFNEPFAPGATGFEWLSRDQAEVRKYVDDPWCGFPFSNGLLLELMKAQRAIWRPENETRIPKDLPVLIVSGTEDPVGGHTASIRALAERYRGAGMRVTERYYAGARHEVFNETNRDEVERDLLRWLASVIAVQD
jgi:alpha-beta hydrolase superfamily lysophospholipase